jgi:NAD(P)-dependent dehydrogenase (short-subunit alcohol dehydrogenase family)
MFAARFSRFTRTAGVTGLSLAAAGLSTQQLRCDAAHTSVTTTSFSASAPSQEFSGKTIIITGAGGEFGRKGSHYFAKRGANVLATDVMAAPLRETGETAPRGPGCGSVVTVVCDVTKPAEVDAMVRTAEKEFGKVPRRSRCRALSKPRACWEVDLLWNNAGYQGKIKPALEYPVEAIPPPAPQPQPQLASMSHAVAGL